MTLLGAGTPVQSTEPNYVYNFDLMRLQAICPVPLFWITEERVRAKRVARFRAYFDGDHDAKLTKEMRELLRIKDNDDGFTLNMMPSVVDTKADRCIVQSIEAITDKTTQTPGKVIDVKATPADDHGATAGAETPPDDTDTLKDPRKNPSAWIQEVMENNHFDIVQGDVHQGTIRDADAYLMLSYDNDEDEVRWTFEEAFDGDTGMLAYYPSRNVPEMALAIKVWQINRPNLNDPRFAAAKAAWAGEKLPDGSEVLAGANMIVFRVNVYYPNRVEKFFSISVSTLQPYVDEGASDNVVKWLDRNDNPLGIPIIHFRNGGRHNYGVSELRNAISPQNALNRFNYSAVMIAELTAFSLLVATGFQPPSQITPAMILTISPEAPLEQGQTAKVERLPAGDLKPILDIIDKERHLIADITRTPSPDLMGGAGGNKTGEYLKQLEIGLLGKVRAFQVRAGASWEAVADMSWDIQAAFSNIQPPAYKRFRTTWRSAELRNETDVVKNAVMMDPIWGHEQTLHATAQVFDLDEDAIAKIVTQQQAEVAKAQAMQAQVQTSVNPATGAVKTQEPAETIAAGQPDTSGNGNAPAQPQVKGNKLPTEQALSTAHLTPEHFAKLFAEHHQSRAGTMAAIGNGAMSK